MKLLTLPEASRQLEVSVSTVKRLVASRQLACVKVGRAVRIEPYAIDEYVATHRSRPLVEGAITSGQIRAFHAKSGELDALLELERGETKSKTLALCSSWVGRTLRSVSDLDQRSASRALDHLEACLQLVRKGER